VTESHVTVSSGDQARDIRERCSLVPIELQNAYDRTQSCEWIRGYLGMRRRNPPEQGRFAGIRVAHKSNVGNLAKLQKKESLLSRLTVSVLPWRTVSRTLKMSVPLAT
jgi:hypothetical protein